MSVDVDDLSCREFMDFLLAYLDEELDARGRLLFEEHIRACPPCLAYLDSYRQTVALTGDAWAACGPGDTVPEEVPEELIQAVLEARRQA